MSVRGFICFVLFIFPSPLSYGYLNVSSCHSSSSNTPSPFYPSFDPNCAALHFLPLLSKPAFVLHTPGFPFLLSQPYILYHNQLRPFSECHCWWVKSARSSFRTTGFYLWHNKDAPRSHVWFLIGLCFPPTLLVGCLYRLVCVHCLCADSRQECHLGCTVRLFLVFCFICRWARHHLYGLLA